MYRAIVQALTRHRPAFGETGALDIREPLCRAKRHSCQACTEAVRKEQEHGKRIIDRNFRLSIECVDYFRKRPNQDSIAVISNCRLPTTELGVWAASAYVRQSIRDRQRTRSQNKPQRQVSSTMVRVPNIEVHARDRAPTSYHRFAWYLSFSLYLSVCVCGGFIPTAHTNTVKGAVILNHVCPSRRAIKVIEAKCYFVHGSGTHFGSRNDRQALVQRARFIASPHLRGKCVSFTRRSRGCRLGTALPRSPQQSNRCTGKSKRFTELAL